MSTEQSPILPGNWLGMLGGGQLARMFCYAAQRMGYKVMVLDPDRFSPAGAVADEHLCAAYDDEAALAQLAAKCGAITTEFENVPAQSLDFLQQEVRVTPSGSAVAIVQDRITEKQFIAEAGVPVAPYIAVRGEADLEQAQDALFPGILKAARFGYDGKGQVRVQSKADALAAFEELGGVDCVLEALQPLKDEISVVVARGLDGEVAIYTPSHNEHRDGILAISTAADAATLQPYHEAAQQAAVAIAKALDYYGVMCVEFFVLDDGSLVANEIAPRPHNSGHFTIEACLSSQYEQQVRVMAGLPLGGTDTAQHSIMLNLLGDLWFDAEGQYAEPDWAALLTIPGAFLHLYGKAEARAARKMGHITVVGSSAARCKQRALQAADAVGLAWHGE